MIDLLELYVIGKGYKGISDKKLEYYQKSLEKFKEDREDFIIEEYINKIIRYKYKI